MIYRLLPVLLLLTACGAASSTDPQALVENWKKVMSRQPSVRFEVEHRADGHDRRQTTWSGTQHSATTGFMGTTLEAEITMRHESRYGPQSYHALRFDQGKETYLEHHKLKAPPGKRFVKLDYQPQVLWVWDVERELNMDSNDIHPSGLFVDLDRDTLRLAEAADNRYVLTAGRGVESNPGTAKGSLVTVTVWVDDEDRVTRAEQTSTGEDGQPYRKTTVLSDWGSAPRVQRPAPETVAAQSEVTWSPR